MIQRVGPRGQLYSFLFVTVGSDPHVASEDKSGATPLHVDCDKGGDTPLHEACHKGHACGHCEVSC